MQKLSTRTFQLTCKTLDYRQSIINLSLHYSGSAKEGVILYNLICKTIEEKQEYSNDSHLPRFL